MKSLPRFLLGASVAPVLFMLAFACPALAEGDGTPRTDHPAADFCGGLFTNSPLLQRAFKRLAGRYPRFELPTYGQEFGDRAAPFAWIKTFSLNSGLKLDSSVIILPNGALLRGQSRPVDFYSSNHYLGAPLASMVSDAPAHAQAREGLFSAALEARTDSNPFDYGVVRFKNAVGEFLQNIGNPDFNRAAAESDLGNGVKHALQQKVLVQTLMKESDGQHLTAFGRRVIESLAGDDTWFGPANVYTLKKLRKLAEATGGLAHEKAAFLEALDRRISTAERSPPRGRFQTSIISRFRLSSFIDLEVQTWWNVTYEFDEQGQIHIDSESGLTDNRLAVSPRQSSFLVRVLPTENMRVDRWQELVDSIFERFAQVIHP